MPTNTFRELIRAHAGATRGGKFGNFQFAFSWNGGVVDSQDRDFFIAPGFEYKFEIRDTAGFLFSVKVRNDSDDPRSGNAFQPVVLVVSEELPFGSVQQVGSFASSGQAQLDFRDSSEPDKYFTTLSEHHDPSRATIGAVKFQGPNIVGLLFNTNGGFVLDGNGADLSTLEVTDLAGGPRLEGGWGFAERL